MKWTKDLSGLLVDGVLCISLINRVDRRALISHEFRDSGLQIEFVMAELDQENPERGCFNSHIRCATLAIQRGYKHVLILEDDATLLAFSPRQITRINTFLTQRNPPLFHLGATLGKIWLTWHLGIARFRVKGAFAYILSNEGCTKILGLSPFSGIPIDNLFSKTFKAYGSFPLICQHQPESLGKSNISPYRIQDGTVADEAFWRRNRRRQFRQAIKNIGKTLIRRDV
ncbi:hypothetical protein [Pseudomonas sp. GXZC]|uniref:hypothetical protein n=1 Tax=Pseudomonas sp. GXZC TaxID=3003351 RepID=UPI0022AAAE96|nr:hypothetical protein [Pseudomonas sp. GXZC]WAT31826.1 hypothetical protein OZ428_16220 [Pseudomonas sp. GXZC]